MLFAEAHSFAQQARLAVTLSWVSGFTNAITLLACGVVTSHVSGTATLLGTSALAANWETAGTAALYILLFFLGACASALLTEEGRRRGWESIYVFPVTLELLLLAGFSVILELHAHDIRQSTPALLGATGLACFAMGLQNATITRISGGVVRTTHVTGVVTDLGLEGVQFLLWVWGRRRENPPVTLRAYIHALYHHPPARRLALLASIIVSFVVGALLGAAAFVGEPRWAMLPPVLFLAFIIYQDLHRPIAEIDESDLTTQEMGLGLPSEMAIFHVHGQQAGDGTRAHRLTGLRRWGERLPGHIRVVLLDLTSEDHLDDDTLAELRRVLVRQRAAGRRLILCGVGEDQQPRIRRALGDDLGPGDLWPDLELALAHALLHAELRVHGHAAVAPGA